MPEQDDERDTQEPIEDLEGTPQAQSDVVGGNLKGPVAGDERGPATEPPWTKQGPRL
jgi:hypothetical protein